MDVDPEPEPLLFGASMPEPKRRSGVATWFAAAASLVAGILIGFGSGYRAGKATVSTAPIVSQQPRPAASGGTTGSKTFSEAAVSEPARVDPQPIVPTTSESRQPPSVAPPASSARPASSSPPARPVEQRPTGSQRAPAAPTPAPPERPTRARTVPPAAPAASGPGSIQVLSRPSGAQVILDGQPVGRTPLAIPDLPAGPHSVRLELPGYQRWATTVDVKAGSAARVAGTLEE